MTWLGYPGTTGLETIDYRLTDPFLDPPGQQNDGRYIERSYRLPETFWCYDPLESSEVGVLDAADFDELTRTEPQGRRRCSGVEGQELRVNDPPCITNGFITFGCLNNFCKVNAPTLDLWSAVLRAMPASRLLLLAPRAARERVLDELLRGGVRSDRVEFLDRMPRRRYLASYRRIDIGLETIPYNGHTTTLDALWMGVPVVTLVGDTPVCAPDGAS